MTIASVLSTKGGLGKITVTTNPGAFCADAGIRTHLIDLDTQASPSSFYRLEHEAPGGTYQLISQNNTRNDQVIPGLASQSVTWCGLHAHPDRQSQRSDRGLHC